MRVSRAVAALLLVATVVVAAPVVAHVTMRWGWTRPMTSEINDRNSCDTTGTIWHQELGMSGVTRLRAKFELRGRYDPGYIPGLTYAVTNWVYSIEFPDDGLSQWINWPFRLRHPVGPTFQVRAILIGERPSFWRPDRKIATNIGNAVCYVDITFGT